MKQILSIVAGINLGFVPFAKEFASVLDALGKIR
jgi:hypothetical protein